jgi:hypothetical protein
LTFYPLKKVAPPLKRVEKKFFKIVRKGQNFVLIQKYAEVLSLAKGEKKFSEKLIFQALRKFSKKIFSEKIALETS